MFTKNIPLILNQFFIREFQQLMDKYNYVNEENTKKIQRLLRLTEEIEEKNIFFKTATEH
ncbi:hypothetical protein [Inediibacterium massiliense]|uniref:hypothetical protein n=1 Tax=Inediibacterium massiliense TaxID=1658111 RepID=UPI0006B5C05E|nr:hypothetical protein [Inediibacterium massiliense]